MEQSLLKQLAKEILELAKDQDTGEQLGFCEPPRGRMIYCSAHDANNNWYMWAGDQPILIEQTALRGYITGVSLKEKTFQSKESLKCILHLNTDVQTSLEFGADTLFARSLVSSLRECDLGQPVVIEATIFETQDSLKLLCARVYQNDQMVFVERGENYHQLEAISGLIKQAGWVLDDRSAALLAKYRGIVPANPHEAP